MYVPDILQTLAIALEAQNAQAIIVGGSVRDHFLNLSIKDYDIEVFGLDTLDSLEDILKIYGKVSLVGKSFGVLKFTYDKETYDFSFPRRETKVGDRHQDFEIILDSNMLFKQAAIRRDFTINALGFDIQSQTFLDPYDGQKDMQAKQLKHINTSTFIEDPLRVYRAIQFCARFNYTLDKETFTLCKQMVKAGLLKNLAKERIYQEWTKLLLKSPKPSQGFELMRTLGILDDFPELQALIAVPQSVKWHPEGDVWIHTLMALDQMAILCHQSTYSDEEKLEFLFAILCHDLGKASSTTVDTQGNIRSIGHEHTGIALSKSLMYRLMDNHHFIASLLPLVEHHLKPSQFYEGKSKAPAIRKLANKVNIQKLTLLAKADFLGRTTPEALKGTYPAGEWLLQKARSLEVATKPLKAWIQGRDLITLGLTPSAQFKIILDEVYTLQLEGVFKDKGDALEFVQKLKLSTLSNAV